MAENQQQKIMAHYDNQELLNRIIEKLAKSGREFSSLRLNDLDALDELHVGGKKASRELARKAGLNPKSRVLDVGSGIGGPARLLSVEFDLEVVGLDLTFSFCRAANILSNTVDVRQNLGFVNGDALHLPFKPGSFDALWSQHSSMNIPDKKKLYQDCFHVLKKEGKLLIHDILTGDGPMPSYPVPWAATMENSFLVSGEEQQALLKQAGFKIIYWEDISEKALSWQIQAKTKEPGKTPPLLNHRLVYGEPIKEMASNLAKNLSENRIKIVEAICQKP